MGYFSVDIDIMLGELREVDFLVHNKARVLFGVMFAPINSSWMGSLRWNILPMRDALWRVTLLTLIG